MHPATHTPALLRPPSLLRPMVICRYRPVSSGRAGKLIWILPSGQVYVTHKGCSKNTCIVESKAYYPYSKAVTHHEELSIWQGPCRWEAKIKGVFAFCRCSRVAQGHWWSFCALPWIHGQGQLHLQWAGGSFAWGQTTEPVSICRTFFLLTSFLISTYNFTYQGTGFLLCSASVQSRT